MVSPSVTPKKFETCSVQLLTSKLIGPDFQSYQIHKKSHKNSTSAQAVKRKCSYCEETFSSRSNLTRHVREVHHFINYNIDLMNPKPKIEPLICDHCDFKTKRKHYLKIHIVKQHSNEPMNCKGWYGQNIHTARAS